MRGPINQRSRPTVAMAHRDRYTVRTLVPTSTLSAAEVQAQATLQTRQQKPALDLLHGKTCRPTCTANSSPASVIPTDAVLPPVFSLDKPTGNACVIASLSVAAAGLTVYSASSSLLALAAPLVAQISDSDPERLAAMTLAGFVAQLVDGSLGMGYGMTSSTVLVASGLSPAAASTSVHLAQLGTAAWSHRRLGRATAHCHGLPGLELASCAAWLCGTLTNRSAAQRPSENVRP